LKNSKVVYFSKLKKLVKVGEGPSDTTAVTFYILLTVHHVMILGK